MADPLLLTKISLPVLRHLLVPRSRILKRFDQGLSDGNLLTLVCAPAGYGKTTAVRMWVEAMGRPVAWVTLEDSDNDLRQFLSYLLTALQQVDTDLAEPALEEVQNAPKIDPRRVLGMMIEELRAWEQPLVVVLEDYHRIEDEKIDQFVSLLLTHPVPNLHLVITSREDPNLPLTRLRARNQLTEIRAIDLSFSLAEASTFISEVMGVRLSPVEMEILRVRTEGWVAGLQLAGLSLRESDDPAKFLEAFRGTHRHILQYLIEEVLESQPEDVRLFLQRTSILDQLTPSLCDAVTGQAGSRAYLDYLDDNNLFVVALDEEQTWYRYHALFGELLRHQLQHTDPDGVDDLHERAADWYQESGFIERAVEHAFQISSGSRVAGLIEKSALPMLYRGEVSRVVGWFDRLPETVVKASPLMCVSKAWALALMLRQTRKGELEQALDAADDALEAVKADPSLRALIAGHRASIEAYALRSPALAGMMAEKVISTSQRAQELLPEEEKGIRSVNDLNIGYGYAALADFPAAEQAFEQALEDGVAGGNYYAAIYGPFNRILIVMMEGRLDDALVLCDENIDYFNRLLAGRSFPPLGGLYILKGSLLLEQDRLVDAEQALLLGLGLERWTGEFRAHTKGYSALARLRFIQGDRSGMLDSLKSLEETRPEGILYAQAWRHRLATRSRSAGEAGLDEASRWLNQAGVDFDRLPDITGMDPVSEINLQAYVCIGHVLARLAAQNPQAHDLESVQGYLGRQERFADSHHLAGWLVPIWIVRALLFQAEGKDDKARHSIHAALAAAAPRGYFRAFLDEADLIRPLLQSAQPHLHERHVSSFLRQLLEAIPAEVAVARAQPEAVEPLSDREREVLGLLAAGKSYKEIGQELFLSVNTVGFHVKNIYGKLQVNKRGQAVDRARAQNLI